MSRYFQGLIIKFIIMVLINEVRPKYGKEGLLFLHNIEFSLVKERKYLELFFCNHGIHICSFLGPKVHLPLK